MKEIIEVGLQYAMAPVIVERFSKEQLNPLSEAIENIKFNNLREYNHKLAGNIEHEYDLFNNAELVNYITNLYSPLIIKHQNTNNYFSSLKVLKTDADLILTSLWVNFQRKNEFNPLHNHTGVYSFVLWYDIPYSIEDEKDLAHSKDSNSNVPGHFGFIKLDSNVIGGISQTWLPVDKTWNFKTALFPSTLLHCVNPFYTSDRYRITVSGNFSLNN
jgi:hypothetical protein